MSCLREEFSECYVPNYSSLAGVSAFPNCRILTPTKRGQPSEQERWQRHFLGPFNGILGSFLTCQSCSFQVMSSICKSICTTFFTILIFEFCTQLCTIPLFSQYHCWVLQITLDFEFFHSLSLSPVLNNGGAIVCLFRYFSYLHIQNFHWASCPF